MYFKELLAFAIVPVLLIISYKMLGYLSREYKFYARNGKNYVYLSKEMSLMLSVEIGRMKLYMLLIYNFVVIYLLFRAISSLLTYGSFTT